MIGQSYQTVAKEDSKARRKELFRAWLSNMTPEKIELLVKFERIVSIFANMRALIGHNSEPKYLKAMLDVLDELRNNYENEAS